MSSGDTPDMWRSGSAVVTVDRPGTYLYLDRSQVARGVGGFDECALTVLATVVSRPTPDWAVIDAGSKALTSDLLGMEGFGRLVEYPDAAVTGLSEEHSVSTCPPAPRSRPSTSGCASFRTTPASSRNCLTR